MKFERIAVNITLWGQIRVNTLAVMVGMLLMLSMGAARTANRLTERMKRIIANYYE